MVRTRTITVRAFDGRIISLIEYCRRSNETNHHNHGVDSTAILRLRRRLELPDPAAMPHDILLWICSFLSVDDWLAFDSTCRDWKEVRRFLWEKESQQHPIIREGSSFVHVRGSATSEPSFSPKPQSRQREKGGACHPSDGNTQSPAEAETMRIGVHLAILAATMKAMKRSDAAAFRFAKQTVSKKWDKLKGFLPLQITLNGPALDDEISQLKGLVFPWSLPPSFLASWKLHDGEWERSEGIYLGARLLTIHEIAAAVRKWKEEGERGSSDSHIGQILRIPLFSQNRARQVAMELWLDGRGTNTIRRKRQDHEMNGTIVVVNSLAPFLPRLKVLATSWEGFLTLM